IDWHGNGTVVDDAQGGGDVGAGTNQNFVAGPDFGGSHCQVQGRCPAGDGHAVAAAAILGEGLLEARNRLAERARNLAPAHGRDHGLDLIVANDRFEYFNHDGSSTRILSFSVPRNGPCLTLMHCMSSITRMAWMP